MTESRTPDTAALGGQTPRSLPAERSNGESATARGTKPYLISYHHNGAKWGLTIHARDEHDCRTILKLLPLATIDGVLMATIPVSRGGFAVPLIVWLRNKLFGPPQ